MPGGGLDVSAFLWGEIVLRFGHLSGAAGLDLDKGDSVAFPRDDIELVAPEYGVAFEDGVTLPLEVAGGAIFTEAAQGGIQGAQAGPPPEGVHPGAPRGHQFGASPEASNASG